MSTMRSTLALLPLLLSMCGVVLAVPSPAVAAAPAARSGFACDGVDAKDKGWVLPIYVHQPGQDAWEADSAALLNTVWETDQTVDSSAERFGVSRRLRVVQDGDCRPVVAKLPFAKGRNRAEMGKAMAENLASQPALVRTLWQTNRVKPLYFVRDNEITDSCTGGGANAGLSTGNVILPRWCWSEAGLTHELIHSFGLSHCDGGGVNGNDPVCRNMGTRKECTSDLAANYHLDSCRIDEFRYFEPTPVRQPELERIRNVAFSPYLIQDQPSPVWQFRIKVVDGGRCLDASAAQVVQRACTGGSAQTWQRGIDDDGYLTIRNAANGRCLTMADTVVTGPCAKQDKSQQWLPQAGQDRTNFAGRAGGKLAVKDNRDGGAVVREGKGEFVAELLGGLAASPTQPSTPAPTATSQPTTQPTAQPTAGPTTTPTSVPEPAVTPDPIGSLDPDPAKTPAQGRNVRFKSAYGTCLTASGTRVRLGACGTTWNVVTVGKHVQVRHQNRCMALGKVSGGKRSVVLTRCGTASKGQRWLLEKAGGSVTLKSATTKATRLVAVTAKPASIYAKAAYQKNSVKFIIK
ncbi:Ricin-type beta-trefoil lectin domain-containing protein [Streptosporangium canum]|uniref:Ricin-type beta-trefoil lectin domain-containing protein n=2 Tax=Streptosporangium canum TaxID=324952 RepID=A0A1I3VXC0_9ACTN|nr:Ricin-type beta-trefoil lectin domain-containing protein [Streptosporangium canum]